MIHSGGQESSLDEMVPDSRVSGPNGKVKNFFNEGFQNNVSCLSLELLIGMVLVKNIFMLYRHTFIKILSTILLLETHN